MHTQGQVRYRADVMARRDVSISRCRAGTVLISIDLKKKPVTIRIADRNYFFKAGRYECFQN